MADKKSVLVLGATGNQGGGTARALLANPAFDVHCLVRNLDDTKSSSLKQHGAKLIQGSMRKKEDVARALTESAAKMLYFMTSDTQKADDEVAEGTRTIDAAKTAGIEFIVFSSVAACDNERGRLISFFNSKFLIEQHLKSSGVPFGILRPVSFFENLQEEKFRNPLIKGRLGCMHKKSTQLQHVSTADIGKAAAQMFLRPDHFNGQTLNCAACRATGEELLDGLYKASGVRCRYVVNPPRWLFFLLSIIDPQMKEVRKMVLWLDEDSDVYHFDEQQFLEVVPDAVASPEAFFRRIGKWSDGEVFSPLQAPVS